MHVPGLMFHEVGLGLFEGKADGGQEVGAEVNAEDGQDAQRQGNLKQTNCSGLFDMVGENSRDILYFLQESYFFPTPLCEEPFFSCFFFKLFRGGSPPDERFCY